MKTFEEWYVELRPLLLHIGTQKFRLPAEDAEEIAHDVFIGLLEKPEIEDVRRYLIASMANGCRSHLRRQRPFEELDLRTRGVAADQLIRARVAEVLRRLPPRERHAVWLHWAAGWKIREVAVYLRMSYSGTQKVIYRAKRAVAEPSATPIDETARRRVRGAAPKTDTYACRRIIRGHVRPLRGAALPRTHPRAAVLSADRRASRQVPGQLPGAHGLLQASRGAA